MLSALVSCTTCKSLVCKNKEANNMWEKHLPSPTMPRTSNLFITSPRVRAPPAGKKQKAAWDLDGWLLQWAEAGGLNCEVQEKGHKCLITFHLQPSSTSLSHLVAFGSFSLGCPFSFLQSRWLHSHSLALLCLQSMLCTAAPGEKHTNHTQYSIMWFAVRGLVPWFHWADRTTNCCYGYGYGRCYG